MKTRTAKILIAGLSLVIFLMAIGVDSPVRRYLLSLVYQETITPEDLRLSYRNKQFKILLVPGHDDEYGGAEFRGLREENLNLLIAAELYRLLASDKHFIVETTREFSTGAYTTAFNNFFQTQRERILAFSQERKNIFYNFLKLGQVTRNVIVNHNFAPREVALRLNGINLWANENNVDLTLHIHVNDVGSRRYNKVAAYYGFSIYVPERQYPNSRASADLADSLVSSLQNSMQISTLPKEGSGVVEDQELLAIGSYATRNGAAVLVEYGYIYEPRWITLADRQKSAKELAERTYEGLVHYLE